MIIPSVNHQLRHISLVVQENTALDIAVWKELFSPLLSVNFVETSVGIDADAQLTSIMACERYGCPTGLRPNTWGQMYIYDDWSFDFSAHLNPRYYISNALWSDEPTLGAAVQMRLAVLFQTLITFNQTIDTPIATIIIQTSVLGVWGDYPYEVQLHAAKSMYDTISRIFINR